MPPRVCCSHHSCSPDCGAERNPSPAAVYSAGYTYRVLSCLTKANFQHPTRPDQTLCIVLMFYNVPLTIGSIYSVQVYWFPYLNSIDFICSLVLLSFVQKQFKHRVVVRFKTNFFCINYFIFVIQVFGGSWYWVYSGAISWLWINSCLTNISIETPSIIRCISQVSNWRYILHFPLITSAYVCHHFAGKGSRMTHLHLYTAVNMWYLWTCLGSNVYFLMGHSCWMMELVT